MFAFDGAAVLHLFLLALEYLVPGKQSTPYEYENTKADEQFKDNLEKIKVNLKDALEVAEIFDPDKMKEKVSFQHLTHIPIEKIHGFIDNYKDSSITDEHRKKWKYMLLSKKAKDKIAEWEFDTDEHKNSEVRYGLVTFAKTSDEKYVDCLIAIYKADFKLKIKSFRLKGKDRMKNFFRYKALTEFQAEGFIDNIAYKD